MINNNKRNKLDTGGNVSYDILYYIHILKCLSFENWKIYGLIIGLLHATSLRTPILDNVSASANIRNSLFNTLKKMKLNNNWWRDKIVKTEKDEK